MDRRFYHQRQQHYTEKPHPEEATHHDGAGTRSRNNSSRFSTTSREPQQQQRPLRRQQQYGSQRLFAPPQQPRYGRGEWVNRKEGEASERRAFRRARRPLVPENKADLERWIPRVMSAGDIVDVAKQCIAATDEFIKLDIYLDQNKRFNSSNLEQLRLEQRMVQQHLEVQPNDYQELIAQCQANQDQFPGTMYCLKTVLGGQRLQEYVDQRAWTEEQLKEWNITAEWQGLDKEEAKDDDENIPGSPPQPEQATSSNNGSNGLQKQEEKNVAGPSSRPPLVPFVIETEGWKWEEEDAGWEGWMKK